MTIHITLADAVASIDKAVALKGEDHVYEMHQGGSGMTCKYAVPSPDGEGYVPDCIVGHVLVDLGVNPDELQYTDDNDHGRIAEGDFSYMTVVAEQEGVFTINDDAANFLARAQFQQDNGMPWGQSVQKAKEDMEIQ